MRWAGKFWKLWLLLSLVPAFLPSARASDGSNPAAGEDPFPLMCADLSGSWHADSGERYSIQQRQCSYLKMQLDNGSDSEVTNVIPDNKTRPDRGSQVRHRWNSPDNATVLETHRVYMQSPGVRITEVTTFERANEDLLLETIYTTIEHLNSPGTPPEHEYSQVVFRRNATTCPSPSQGQQGQNDGLELPRKKHKA